MAVATTLYLFDVEGFQNEIAPLIQQFQMGRFDKLQAIATRIAREKPQIWSLLADFRLYPDDLGNEDGEFPDTSARVNFWMMIVLASSCQPLDFSVHGITTFVPVLQKYDWTERDMKRLLIGNSQCALLQPALVLDRIKRPSRYEDWPIWCRFGRLPALTGWLDLTDIRDLLDRLSVLSKRFRVLESYELVSKYNLLVTVLATAERANLGLFIATTD
jgi:hypothetical protein